MKKIIACLLCICMLLTSVIPVLILASDTTDADNLDIYLFIGQSNMASRASIPNGVTGEVDGVYLYNLDGTFEPAAFGVAPHYSSGGKQGYNRYSNLLVNDENIITDGKINGYSCGFSFAEVVMDYTNSANKLGFVYNAKGNTSLAEWSKGSGTQYYEKTVARTLEALKHGTLKGILWHQGEADRTNAAYLTQLNTFVTNLRNDLGVDDSVPFVASMLTPTGDDATNNGIFNSRLENIGSYISNAHYIIADDTTFNSDGLHLDTASQILQGERYAAVILAQVYDVDVTEPTPTPAPTPTPTPPPYISPSGNRVSTLLLDDNCDAYTDSASVQAKWPYVGGSVSSWSVGTREGTDKYLKPKLKKAYLYQPLTKAVALNETSGLAEGNNAITNPGKNGKIVAQFSAYHSNNSSTGSTYPLTWGIGQLDSANSKVVFSASALQASKNTTGDGYIYSDANTTYSESNVISPKTQEYLTNGTYSAEWVDIKLEIYVSDAYGNYLAQPFVNAYYKTFGTQDWTKATNLGDALLLNNTPYIDVFSIYASSEKTPAVDNVIVWYEEDAQGGTVTSAPQPDPTETPVQTDVPTVAPTVAPTAEPTPAPTATPDPTVAPTIAPVPSGSLLYDNFEGYATINEAKTAGWSAIGSPSSWQHKTDNTNYMYTKMKATVYRTFAPVPLKESAGVSPGKNASLVYEFSAFHNYNYPTTSTYRSHWGIGKYSASAVTFAANASQAGKATGDGYTYGTTTYTSDLIIQPYSDEWAASKTKDSMRDTWTDFKFVINITDADGNFLNKITVDSYYKVAGTSEWILAQQNLSLANDVDYIDCVAMCGESSSYSLMSIDNVNVYLNKADDSSSEAIKGDINGDGLLNVSDATLLTQYIAGWSVDITESVCDVNKDGSVNATDITVVLQIIAGWDV